MSESCDLTPIERAAAEIEWCQRRDRVEEPEEEEDGSETFSDVVLLSLFNSFFAGWSLCFVLHMLFFPSLMSEPDYITFYAVEALLGVVFVMGLFVEDIHS